MAQTLPNEILINIIKQCIEPHSIKVQPKVDTLAATSYGPVMFTGPCQTMNLRLTNKMFCEELYKALHSKFDGELTVLWTDLWWIHNTPSFLKSQVHLLRTTSPMIDGGLVSNQLTALLKDKSFPSLREVHVVSDIASKVSKHYSSLGGSLGGSWETWSSGSDDQALLKLTGAKLKRMRKIFRSLCEKNIMLIFEYVVAIRDDKMIQIDVIIKEGSDQKYREARVKRRAILPLVSKLEIRTG